MGITPHIEKFELSILELSELLGKNPASVRNYLKRGLSDLLLSQKPQRIYAPTALDWYIRNEIEGKLDKKSADEELKIMRKKKLELEVKQLEGELVSVSALDDSQAALAGLLVSQYKQLLVQIPHEFQDPKIKKKLRKILDKKFKKNIVELRKTLEAKED